MRKLWDQIVHRDIPRAYKHMQNVTTQGLRAAKYRAEMCARAVKRQQLKVARVAKDYPAKFKKIAREV